jgi:hypothetical protein
MALNESQRKKLEDWFRQHPLPTTCSICGEARSWVVNDTVFEMREFNDGNLIIGGQTKVMPVISVNCSNCGNLILLSAIKIGVIKIGQDGKLNGGIS